MSISKRAGPRAAGSRPLAAAAGRSTADVFDVPATVTRRELLERGSDKRFRALVYDLLTISSRMNAVREYLARRMKLSGPQYSMLMAIAQFQDEGGVGVGALARLLHVSSAFVATESGKLSQAGLVQKRVNPSDRRGVLLSLSHAGRALIESNSRAIRAVNDEFFGLLDRKTFAAVSAAMSLMVAGSGKAIHRVRLLENEVQSLFSEAAE